MREHPKRSIMYDPVLKSPDSRQEEVPPMGEVSQRLNEYLRANPIDPSIGEPGKESREGSEGDREILAVLARAVLQLEDKLSALQNEIDSTAGVAHTDGQIGFPIVNTKERREE